MKEREYIDPDHSLMLAYYDVLERGLSDTALLKAMEKFIAEDPYFFDPYLVAKDLYYSKGETLKSNDLLDKGYQLALERIQDKQGNFPDILEWGWLENRHIIRILCAKGIFLWEITQKEAALALFRNLLKSNPSDNIGARFYLLAILEGLTYNEYVNKFEAGDFMSDEVFDWFNKKSKKYKEDFKVLEEFE